MNFIIIIIIIVLIIIIIRIKNKNIKNIEKFNHSYNLKEGNFKVRGTKKKFIITKDNRYEFLIINGQIVACKDKEIQKDFVYYGDDNNV